MLHYATSIFYLFIYFACKSKSLELHPQNGDSSLIYYRASSDQDTLAWIKRLDQFLAPYTKPGDPNDVYVKCRPGIPPETGSGKVCDVKVDQWFPCTSATAYGFRSDEGGPCIFLTLPTEPNWEPEYYNSTTLPADAPAYLKHRILDNEQSYRPDLNKIVWVSCYGENPIDIENMGGHTYYPQIGFGGEYFPAGNRENYLHPLIAVHFEGLTRGIVVSFECKAWARNIDRDPSGSVGYVHFDLMVDY